MRNLLRCLAATAVFFVSNFAFAQLPGQIIKRHAVNAVLDPGANGFTAATTNGFISNDVAESRIPFKVVRLPFSEPVGDLKTGATGSFTDLVTTPTDETGMMLHFDGNNLLFRLRVSGISSGAKAYSVLIDADMRAGNTGSQADPNYIAPTTSGNGNPGFEWELVLMTGNTTRVVLYEVDGKAGSSIVQQHAVENNNYQVSKALSTTHNDADYFFDFYLPIAQFTGLHQIIASNKFRMVATTVSSPTSALQGNRSDVFGVNDGNYALTADAWMAALGGSPGVSLNELSGSTTNTFGQCTSTPTITSTITQGSNVTISGTWTAASGGQTSATINLYKQVAGVWTFVAATSAPVASGASWSIAGVTVSTGEAYAARAVGAGESECLYSASVYSSCAATINPSVLTQSSSKGICGSMTTGATRAEIYKFDGTSMTLQNANDANMTYTPTSFTWWACSGGSGNLSGGTYMVILTGNGCSSTPVFTCITTGSSAVAPLTQSTGITFPAVIYPFHTSISGSVPASASLQRAYLFIGGKLINSVSIPANTTSYLFENLQLRATDNIAIYLGTNASNTCAVYNTTSVHCYNTPPIITAPGNKLQEGGTTISGTSAANASIRINKTAGTAAGPWTTTADANGAWSVTVPALLATDTYTATTVSSGSCGTASAASAAVTVAAVTTACASFGAASYGTTAPYTAGGTVNVTTTGSVVRLYLDGALVGSQTLNTTGSNIAWSITSAEPFYNGGKLTVTFQSGATGTEKIDCSAAIAERTVTCSAPASPTINPPTSAIQQGQTQTYTVGNIQTGLWYSVIHAASGVTYAGTQAPGSSNLSLTTRAFTTPGTYNLVVEANDFSGCPVATAAAALTVNEITLPVRFLSIAAQKSATGNQVKWVVASEQQVKQYVVERSADCSRYEPVGVVNYSPVNAAENQYVFTDVTAREQKYCYRIKQVDENGSFTYSSIVTVQAKEQPSVSLFPNPAHSQAVLNVTSNRNEIVTIDLMDVAGKVVSSQKVQVQKGANAIRMANLSQYGKGTYVVRLVTFEDVSLLKFILQ
ncbi:T9SS type A sorting domain-containing protein [Flavisolibacter sp. BT320]|nr:T9SS type A sorting domain-containing protein [Flavisolibacter longurius]